MRATPWRAVSRFSPHFCKFRSQMGSNLQAVEYPGNLRFRLSHKLAGAATRSFETDKMFAIRFRNGSGQNRVPLVLRQTSRAASSLSGTPDNRRMSRKDSLISESERVRGTRGRSGSEARACLREAFS